jgi:putative ubiquitin-RnfH superfamily antitoxin RatB of RatAB toxin-antitoxin module
MRFVIAQKAFTGFRRQMANEIQVDVCFITPQKQFLRTLRVPRGTTIQQAIQLSGLLTAFPDTDFNQMKVGIYSKIRTPDTVLREHDRVEIYRPLEMDPMTARRRRAEKRALK